jgi:hypothetical protein
MASSVHSSGTINYRNIVLKSSLNNEEGLNFLHINPCSLRKKLVEVSSLVSNLKLHILAVSETWFNSSINDNLISISGFSVVRHDRNNRIGGGDLV